MATIGNPGRFAVEFERDARSPPDFPLGRFCYWVGGQRVGDYDHGTSFGTVIYVSKVVVASRGRRYMPRLMSIPLATAFEEVRHALCDDQGSDAEVAERRRVYSRFVSLLSGVDSFDRWLGYAVEDDNRARFMWQEPAGRIQEVFLKAGEIEDVLSDFLKQEAAV